MATVKELLEFKDYEIKESIIHFVLNDYRYVVEANDEDIENELKGLDEVAGKIIGGKDFPKYSNDCDRCVYRIFCKK